MKVKHSLETVSCYEESVLVYARARSELPKLVRGLSQQLRGLTAARVSVEQDNPFDGLVENLLHPPLGAVRVALRPCKPSTVLMRGERGAACLKSSLMQFCFVFVLFQARCRRM